MPTYFNWITLDDIQRIGGSEAVTRARACGDPFVVQALWDEVEGDKSKLSKDRMLAVIEQCTLDASKREMERAYRHIYRS